MKILNLFVAVSFSIVATFVSTEVSAQPPGWLYQVPITIYEHSGTDLFDHQVPIVFNTMAEIAAGKMQLDGDDIRFGETCSGPTIDYWVEGYMNTDTTKIWVKIPSLPANDSITIMMFFGKLGVSSLSDINIFEGPFSGNDSIDNGTSLTQGAPNRQRGFFFNGSRDLLVTKFGKNEPNGSTRYLTLFDSISQAQIHQIQVSGPAASLSYASVGQPLWLNRYQTYLISIFLGTGDQYYNSSGNTQVGPYLQYSRTGWCNACTENTFPTNTTTGHFGFPDFEYYVRDSASIYPTFQIKAPLGIEVGPDVGMCAGDSAQVNPTWWGGVGPYAFSWSPSFNVSNSTIPDPWIYWNSGEIFLTITDDLNCMAIDSLEALGLPQPFVDLGPDTAACGLIVLDAGPFDTFLWQDGSTDQTFDVTIPGLYYVTAWSAAGCSSSDSVFVDFCVGQPDVKSLDFSVYPNPAKDEVLLNVSSAEAKQLQINIHDLNGRAVGSPTTRTVGVGNNSLALNIEGLASGTYLISVTDEDGLGQRRSLVVK